MKLNIFDFKEPIKIKDIPSGAYIMVGLIALAMAWAISSMGGCIVEERKAFYEYRAESQKAFWGKNENE